MLKIRVRNTTTGENATYTLAQLLSSEPCPLVLNMPPETNKALAEDIGLMVDSGEHGNFRWVLFFD
jgi:hypothetical protein